ncbi:MAG: S8 family serine peptidase [Gemmatimonadaceae bacterium]|nr:S8 family serine peptidase [Gemmatimonadaceae bacterium]
MRHLLAGCFGILCIAACNDASTAPAPSQASAPKAPAVSPSADAWTGHYIVVLKSGAPSSDALVHRHSLSKQLKMDQRFGTVMRGFSAAVTDDDIDSLRNDPDVESVVQDRFVHQLGTETGMGWALDRVDQKLMPLNGAFAYGATGAGVNIYVVDGGIRYTHTEFGGRAKLAYDALGGDGSDCSGHGTGVAGIAGGSVHGVAKDATIWSVRVFPCNGTTTLSTILAGVDWVTANHKSPAVANLSLGAAAAPILDSAVERSIRAGVSYVVAGGNNNGDACTMSPGKLKDVINVGSTDASDTRASWSNYGSCISMFAPGVAVASADYYSDVSLASWNGTSMSAPMVAGAVALYLQGHPTATPATVRSAIVGNSTAATVKNLSGSGDKMLYTAWIGSGTATPPPAAPPAPPPVAPAIPTVSGAAVSYNCSKNVCAFDASASKPKAGVSSYAWTFGDGTFGSGSKWVHTYPSSANFTWSVKIVDKAGKSYSAGKAITPASATGAATSTVPPATPPSTPVPSPLAGVGGVGVSYKCVAKLCVFDASASQPTNGVTAYYWTFGDGMTATGRNVSHTYGSAASYTWHVSIATGTGKKYLTIKTITPASASGSSTSIVPYYVP